MKFLFFLSIFCVKVLAFRVFDQNIGSQCSTKFKAQNGICMEAKNCPEFEKSKHQLEICSFDGVIPIVCCPERSQRLQVAPKRISIQKCEEYASQRPGEGGCGVSTQCVDGKIVTGKPWCGAVSGFETYVREFPHMSAIGWRLGTKILWNCGGSLISETFVLSAAHCTKTSDGKPSVIRIGDRDLYDDKDCADFQQFDIKNIITHPKYKINSKYHDIALFELNRKAKFNKDVHPACLHQIDDDLSDYNFNGMGWGQTSFGGQSSNKLLKVELKSVDNNECSKSYNADEELNEGITNEQICAWDPKGKQDTCLGDSGGPLLIKKFIGYVQVYEIVGITSFGVFCAAGVPGVYVKVSSYIDWIERVVWPNKLYFT